MKDKDNNYDNFLKKIGLKVTKGRRAIIKILRENEKPMTYEEVFKKLRINEYDLDISTVYRTLETFVQKDVLFVY